MRPASCSSDAPSATNTSVMDARWSAKPFSRLMGPAGSYIDACGRLFVAMALMPRSTDLARSGAPEICLASATRRMPETRSRDGPQATYRVSSNDPRVDASWAMLMQTALARNLRSVSLCASYRHHAIVVCLRRRHRVTASNSFRRMRCNSAANSATGGAGTPSSSTFANPR